jgi:type IV fimbrial biogenesis protein FimT
VDRMSIGLPRPRGFTLLELMITLSIVAVTLTLAAPSMRQLIHATQVRTEVSRLRAAINLARSEAVIRNSSVSVCPSTMAVTGLPICSGAYADGWIIFSNRDRDKVVDAGSDEVIRVFEALPRGYTMTNRAGTRIANEIITFLSDGSSRRNRTLLVCSPFGDRIEPWSVVMNIVGRVRMTRDWGTCPDSGV